MAMPDAATTSSGQTLKTTGTTLTVRQSNVISNPTAKESPSKSLNASKPTLPVSSPNPNSIKAPIGIWTTALVPAGKNSSISSAASLFAPDAPLPTPRQLSKVMCRIVDDEAYTNVDSLMALQRLQQWALQQDIQYGNALVEVGCIQHVLFFVEDHQTDANTIASALLLLQSLTTPLDDNEDAPLTNMRLKVSQTIVDGQGIELLLRAFEYHGLPDQFDSAGGRKGRESFWNTISTMWNCDHSKVADENTNPLASVDSLVINACTVLSGRDNALARSSSFSNSSNTAIDTAILCMKILAKVVPCAVGAVPDKSADILSTLVDAIPKLVNSGKNTSSLSKEDQQALIASIMSCLASAVKHSEGTVLKNNNNNAMSKQVIDITVKMMREFPQNAQIVCDGCLVLQGVCPHLKKSERKKYGVVAALGAVVASDNIMDKKVKEIADAILEEQFK
jgi:hypothetical protein